MEANLESPIVRPKPKRGVLGNSFKIACLAACALFFALFLAPDEDSLLHLAKPVNGLQLPSNVYYSTYAWMPDSTIRFLSWTEPRGNPVALSYHVASCKQIWSRT